VTPVGRVSSLSLPTGFHNSQQLRTREEDMPNVDWKWFLIGAAVGYFAVPYAVNLVKSRG
jgi:hypothetical protein